VNRLRQLATRVVHPDRVSGRALRCLAVSVGTTILSGFVLVTLVLALHVGPATANVVAVCCGIPPSYAANRRWTWGRSGRGSVAREVVPFWVLSLTGLALSTVVVAVIGSWSVGWSDAVRAVVLPMTEAGTFAVLWVVQFVLLDRVIFRAARAAAAPADAVLPLAPRTDTPPASRTPVAA
jgi:putative flippase GtrA